MRCTSYDVPSQDELSRVADPMFLPGARGRARRRWRKLRERVLHMSPSQLRQLGQVQVVVEGAYRKILQCLTFTKARLMINKCYTRCCCRAGAVHKLQPATVRQLGWVKVVVGSGRRALQGTPGAANGGGKMHLLPSPRTYQP